MAAAAFFFDAEPLYEPRPAALDACARCARPLGRDADIFMYRGDTPFCSEECRDEQMQLDAIRARQAARAAGRRQQQQQHASRTESRHQESRKVSAVAS